MPASSAHKTFRNRAVLALVFGLALVSIATVTVLQQRADTSRVAQVRISTLKDTLNELQSAPLKSDQKTGGSPVIARTLMRRYEGRIRQALRTMLATGSPPAGLKAVEGPLQANFKIVQNMYALGVEYRTIFRANAKPSAQAVVSPIVIVVAFERILGTESRSAAKVIALLESASSEYDRRAARAETQTLYGSAVAILFLFGAFWHFYRRSAKARGTAEVLVAENRRLLISSQEEALTDALTGLGNRRALVQKLDESVVGARPEEPVALVLFDLDGFKQYNDAFGHQAGDALLARLGVRLAEMTDDDGGAFRMGGDEFCLLTPVEPGEAEQLARRGGEALSEAGTGFDVGCSWGLALIPGEAASVEAALRLADERMYEHKASSRTSASRQTTDVLIRIMAERDGDLRSHLSEVARLARLIALELQLPEAEVRYTTVAAELHDVGKAAIPEAILNKPGPLDDGEWLFMRRHTLIGERILRAAPSLAHTADLVRSSHEWVDGTGYPDGLKGEEISVGARIIAVCDAYDAMTSTRPYREALTREAALAELRRASGSQFDATVVDVFCDLAAEERIAA